MKKLFLASLLLLLFPQTILAHGGPPFTSINGEKTLTNQIFAGSALFRIAYELGAQNYLVGQNLSFELDPALMPVDPNQIAQATFTWEFGDGSKKTGMNVQYTYSKTGSFIISLKVSDPSTPEPVEIESIKINVLPSVGYQLPEAVVSANGKVITDALKNPVLANPGDITTLDGTKSKGKIKTYEWDLGDGSKLVKGSQVKHNFEFTGDYVYSIFPILKVTDEKGFTAETTIQISNQSSSDQPQAKTKSQTKTKASQPWLIYLLIGGGVILVTGGLLFLRKKPS